MSAKDGRKYKDKLTRKYRRQYTKCRKHTVCRETPDSIWRKR